MRTEAVPPTPTHRHWAPWGAGQGTQQGSGSRPATSTWAKEPLGDEPKLSPSSGVVPDETRICLRGCKHC